MKNLYKNNMTLNAGSALMLLLLVATIISLPVSAEVMCPTCASTCYDELQFEDHSLQPGMDSTDLPAPIPDFCVCWDSECDSLEAYFIDYSQGVIRTWAWDFGDPASGADNYSSLENPTHMYRDTGSYTVTLTVTGYDSPVSIVKSDVVTVKTVPVADFIFTPDSGCVATMFKFEDRSVGGGGWLEWYWQFGDGTTSTEQNPTHTYAAPGTYSVLLFVRNSCGSDQIAKILEVVVGETPVAAFDYELGPNCEGAAVSFFDRSTNADSWFWEFGDGVTSVDQNPTHTYTTAGNYDVKLTVTNDCGSDDTTQMLEITLGDLPIADFSSDVIGECSDATVTFTNLSTNAVTYLWDFGDGTTSTDIHPVHIYALAGTYTVSLTATNSCGDDTETKVEQVVIEGLPVADFVVLNRTQCVMLPIIFTDLSTNATSWLWDFGDGATSPEMNPVHMYADTGSYTVTLLVRNDCGDDTEIKELYITIIDQPQADFSSDLTDLCVGGVVSFTDLSLGASAWHWTFGDGSVSSTQNPTHLYSSPGLYSVTLKIASACGEDEITKTEYITIQPIPTADFIALNPVSCDNTPVVFEDRSTFALTWHWDFGDGNISSDQNPTHTYAAPGIYAVRLAVSNDCGEDVEIKEQYIRIGQGPIADFRTFTQEWCVGMPVDFEDLSIDADSWLWDFGDGTTSTQRHPSHTYQTAGLFTVSLTVTNDCGTDTETRVNYMLIHPLPVADFIADQTDVCVGATIAFTDLSNEADRWDWNFGDGTGSPDQNPIHIYNVAGTYTVSLTVSNGCGDDEETKTAYITVSPEPIAHFDSDSYIACVEEPIQFTDHSLFATSWEWHFGDGTTSTDQNPIHTYDSAGVYDVWLAVRNDCGYDSEYHTGHMTILEGPTAGFTANQTDVCVGASVNFTNTSTNATSWTWEFGDGGNSQAEHPSHTYNTPGTYMVQMVAYNSCGDDVAIRDNYITVRPKPTADFTMYGDMYCVNEPVSFGNRSLNADSYLWDFGDGTTSTDENPSHAYASVGTYTISLTAYNDCGEDDAEYNNAIMIIAGPTADFTADNPNSCVGEIVTFTSNSPNAMFINWDFGDGQTDGGRIVGHAYQAVGVYTVTMWAVNDCGIDSLVREAYITVGERPLAGYKADKYDICVGGTVNFTDQSLRADSWLWEFGDGTQSLDQHPSHTYNHAGTYNVYLKVSNPCGTDYTNFPLIIEVQPEPTADFFYGKSEHCYSTEVDFHNQSAAADSYLWDFGDGTTSTDENPSHSYTVAGNYDVKLVATNSCGDDDITKPVSIYIPEDPIADFIANKTIGCVDSLIHFTDKSVRGHFYDWDFGDGSTSNLQNPTHAYASPGVYTVKLRVDGTCGSDSETKTDYLTINPGPQMSFTATSGRICEGGTVEFTDKSIDATSYYWEFGDGTTSTQKSPTHTYTSAGTYHVLHGVFNECGSDGDVNAFTVIVSPPPTADFSYEKAGECGPETVTFTNLSNVGDSWLWDFGDGTTSTDKNPTHGYITAGTYDVKLTATNSCGSDDITKPVLIEVTPPPIAAFTANKTNICVGGMVQFTDQSIGALSYDWDFGDGFKSKYQNPVHHYTTPGQYTVTLEITGACGTDYESKEHYITVESRPIADFSADKTDACTGSTIAFTDLSVGATRWIWSFGDGQSSISKNPTHTYNSPGVYTVRLTASNECGSDLKSKTDYITIHGGPIADFGHLQLTSCDSGIVSFSDNSIYATGWYWEFGDGSFSNERNPIHTYATDGDYKVTLTASNDCGDDKKTKTITVELAPGPTADFGTEVNEVCIGETVYLFDQSTGVILTWLWDFGDGTTAIERNPEHIYTAGGSYRISLTVTDACGEDTETKVNYVTVLSGPTADFDATPRSGAPTLQVTFTDLSVSSQGIFNWTWDFGDGGSSTLQNPTHDYTAVGIYTVSLIVEDACGLDTTTKLEYIEVNDSCSVDFWTEVNQGCAPLTAWFGGTTIGDCDITEWLWDFGDPTSGSLNFADSQQVEHVYANGGTYTVTMTAINGLDTMVVSKTNLITVYGGPTASFTASPFNGISPLTTSFTDQSTSPNGTITWDWDFGDPTSGPLDRSTDQNPTHTFVNNGVYTVTLIATDMCGPDTTTETITVAAALELTKTVDKPIASAGEILFYSMTLRNNGPEAYGSILIIDSIPDMTSYVANSIGSSRGTNIPAGDMVAWMIPDLAPGSEETFTFEVLLDGPFVQVPSIVYNHATATTGTEGYAKPLQQTTIVSNVVQTIVDIPSGVPTIDKDVDIANGNPGDILTYTITVTNNQPSAATGLKVYDAPPDYTTFYGGITGGGVYDPLTDSLFWDLGTLPMFSDTTVSFQVTVDNDAPSGLRIPNSALFVTDFGGDQSDTVITVINLEPLVISKTVNRPSGMIGDLIRFTIKISNFSDQQFSNLELLDTLPVGLTYVNGTSLLDGAAVTDPTGTNPITWQLGNLAANSSVTLVYSSLISPAAQPGLHDNIARAQAIQNGNLTNSNRAVAQIYILSYTISGSIRGRVIVDCDGDGVPDIDSVPSGMDIFLDDGSHSRVNNKGMFYFSTVRPGERVVALDKRDLNDFFVPEGAQSSVFVHVHEAGESYVLFRICPDYPQLDIEKKASIIPTVKVTKRATINPEPVTDSMGVLIDYEIDIKSNGLAEPTDIRVVDSFPEQMNLILSDMGNLTPNQTDNQIVYELTADDKQLHESVFYSLKDMAPGVRRFLTNKVHLEGDPSAASPMNEPTVSEPAEVAVGPFLMAPPMDVKVTLTPALFITSKAFLQAPAFPLLRIVADSIRNYPDAEIIVEGHTDLRIINTVEFPSNWELGEARAKAVVNWLIDSAGISGDRMTYESFAATRPVVTDVPINSMALQPNRRTEVIIKAGVAGFLAPAAEGTDSWASSTSLALAPNNFDTLFEQVENPVTTDLDDSWEVVIKVINQSEIGAEIESLTDLLPDGTEYLAGSATLDDATIYASVEGTLLTLDVKQIKPLQTLVLRYRIRTIDGLQPTGGGAASIEVKTASDLPVVQSSNTVNFK